ncbi:hypothetical protein [Shewanella sp. UCD-KL12]|uniref:hypothetical protein n=1 Tax=Shewanella sp. UCD-KL12 TaxID=1917163 RepID=UPI00117D542A|nr:hypothetical protein [Shewanella sp. UCD-KL12]
MPNVSNAWMQFLTKLSGGSTAMDGGSVDIEGAFIDRHRESLLRGAYIRKKALAFIVIESARAE